jgi:hypothetical protein
MLKIADKIKLAMIQGNPKKMRMCRTKRRFGCLDAAQDFLIEHKLDREMHGYQCFYCKFWHIGHISNQDRNT